MIRTKTLKNRLKGLYKRARSGMSEKDFVNHILSMLEVRENKGFLDAVREWNQTADEVDAIKDKFIGALLAQKEITIK